MKTKVTISVVAAIVLLAGLGQANAASLYNMAPDYVPGGGYNGISSPYLVACPFTVDSNSTATSVTVHFVSNSGQTPSTFDYKIGATTPTASDFNTGLTTVTASTSTNVFPGGHMTDAGWGSNYGYVWWDETFTIPNTSLNTGTTYWLTIGHVTVGADYVPGTPSASTALLWTGSEIYGGNVPVKAFEIMGTVPEPATMSMLVLSGMAALIRRRNRA